MSAKIIRSDSAEFSEINPVMSKNQELLQRLNTTVLSVDEQKSLIAEVIGQPIAETTEIRLPFRSDYGANIRLGKKIFINSGVMLVDLGGITLDDEVLIGPNVTIISVNHVLDPADRRSLSLAPVHIHRNAWVGANATVLPGVTIGENAVVAAGAVVTKDVPANTIVAGVPAKVIDQIER